MKCPVCPRLLRAAHPLETAGVPYAIVCENAVAAWTEHVDEARDPDD